MKEKLYCEECGEEIKQNEDNIVLCDNCFYGIKIKKKKKRSNIDDDL